MKRLLSILLAMCCACVCSCALAESYTGVQVQVGDAKLTIPQSWVSADLEIGDEAAARFTDGERQIALYLRQDTTMDALLQELMRREDEVANVTTVMLGDRMAVQFDWLTQSAPCLAVGDDTLQKQMWFCYSPVTDSELSLLVGEVARSVCFQ